MHSSFSSVPDLVPLLDTVSFLGIVFQILEDYILEHFLALDSGFASCFYFLSCRPDEVRVELLDILEYVYK